MGEAFAQDLLWKPGTNRQPRPKKWRAPTWSWASVDSAVCYPRHFDTSPCIERFTIECVPVGEDVTGELSSGYAVLRGSIMAASFRYKPAKNRYERCCVVEGGYEYSFSPDYEYDIDDESHVQDGDRVFCLRITIDYDSTTRGYDDCFLVPNNKQGEIEAYERIGMKMIPGSSEESVEWHLLFESRKEERTMTIV